MKGTFFADELDWYGSGYSAEPTPTDDPDRRANHAGDLWIRWESILDRARAGDFRTTAELPGLYLQAADRRSPTLRRAIACLLGDAGTRPAFAAAIDHIENPPRRDPVLIAEYCRAIAWRGWLADLPFVLDGYTGDYPTQEFDALPLDLAVWLGPREGPLSEPPEIDEDEVEAYAERALTRYREIRDGLGTDQVFVWSGRNWDLTEACREFLGRLGNDPEDQLFQVAFRRRFEAHTGIDCTPFFEDLGFRPLAAAAIVEEFLESPEAEHYEPGVRYFFGHRIPD